jgi:hypothetical protein
MLCSLLRQSIGLVKQGVIGSSLSLSSHALWNGRVLPEPRPILSKSQKTTGVCAWLKTQGLGCNRGLRFERRGAQEHSTAEEHSNLWCTFTPRKFKARSRIHLAALHHAAHSANFDSPNPLPDTSLSSSPASPSADSVEPSRQRLSHARGPHPTSSPFIVNFLPYTPI